MKRFMCGLILLIAAPLNAIEIVEDLNEYIGDCQQAHARFTGYRIFGGNCVELKCVWGVSELEIGTRGFKKRIPWGNQAIYRKCLGLGLKLTHVEILMIDQTVFELRDEFLDGLPGRLQYLDQKMNVRP